MFIQFSFLSFNKGVDLPFLMNITTVSQLAYWIDMHVELVIFKIIN